MYLLPNPNKYCLKKASRTHLFLVKFIAKSSNRLDIEHRVLNSPIIIPHYGFHFRLTDLTDKPDSQDSGSICKQTAYTLL